MMKQEKLYTISELAEAANVTPRTVRYYTSEELLPPPDSRGRYTLYTTAHLQRLQLISRLKALYLPLSEIKARLSELDDTQISELLAEAPPAVAESSSAADYLTQVLQNQPKPVNYDTRLSERKREEAPMLQVPPSSPPAPAPAVGAAGAAPGAPAQAPAPPSASRGGLLGKLLPRSPMRAPLPPQPAAPPAEAQPATPAETWQRIVLAPGVELHVRSSSDPSQQQRIAQLLAQAHTIFEIE